MRLDILDRGHRLHTKAIMALIERSRATQWSMR